MRLHDVTRRRHAGLSDAEPSRKRSSARRIVRAATTTRHDIHTVRAGSGPFRRTQLTASIIQRTLADFDELPGASANGKETARILTIPTKVSGATTCRRAICSLAGTKGRPPEF